jgi:hypothetical protein
MKMSQPLFAFVVLLAIHSLISFAAYRFLTTRTRTPLPVDSTPVETTTADERARGVSSFRIMTEHAVGTYEVPHSVRLYVVFGYVALAVALVLALGGMKRALTIAVVVLGVALGGMIWASRTTGRHERQCHQNMEFLYSAAVSVCLEQKLRPDELLTIDRLAPYLRPSVLTCPSSHASYAAFSVLEGPTCPTGHKYAPGEKRPLRTSSSNRKVAGLYLANGFTNLVDDARGQQP